MVVHPPGQRHPAIRQWAGRLQELVDATDLSLRQLADHVPWSHSTLARYLSGERVVDEAWQLVPTLVELSRKRGNGSPVDLDELRTVYLRARQAYQEQQRANRNKTNQPVADDSSAGATRDDEEIKPSDSTEALPPDKARYSTVALLAVIVGVALVLGTVGTFTNGWLSPREVKVWQAKIVGTWSQQYKQNLGVFRFRSPDLSGDTDKATYHEGTTVSIVCQSRHRRLVNDPTSGQSSAVWNKLHDGYWIPDLYTDLPKVSGEAPPLGIPLCP